MKRALTEHVPKALAILTLCLFTSQVFAQGTATGPNTTHQVDPGPVVVIGDPTNPFPIDLDPTGPPWTKTIVDPNQLILNGGLLTVDETIINVGNEPWLDWHEHILPDPFGVVPGIWLNVNMLINGNPIGFNVIGLGTPDLWLDTFTQPVLPGDVLSIRKVMEVTPGIPGTFTQPIIIEEYPTPEPASAALISLGSLMLLARRKSESI